MSAMSDFDIEVNEALDKFINYMDYDSSEGEEYDEYTNEDLRWDFIDAAVAVLEKLTQRDVGEERSK